MVNYIFSKGGIIVVEGSAEAMLYLRNFGLGVGDDLAGVWSQYDDANAVIDVATNSLQGNGLGALKVLGASAYGGAIAAGLAIGALPVAGVAVVLIAGGYAAGKLYEWAFNEAMGIGQRAGQAAYEIWGDSGIDPATITTIKSKLATASGMPSPIIFDLDGDGVETTAVVHGSAGGAHFDHAADGFAEQTGWVGKDDGLLVRDLDGDGLIESGRELFGSETLLANGSKAANGFAALAELDTDNDGKISSADAAYATLRVWKDADSDGTTDAGELVSLADAGVQSINVGYTTSSAVDANGNQHRQAGSYTTTAGATRAATDVWFKTDQTFSVATEWLDVPADIAALPDAKGYGKVYDLHQAMVRDGTGVLKWIVTQFTQASTASERSAWVQNIIYHWTGVQTIDPGSRAPMALPSDWDTRKIEALEQFMGEDATKRIAVCARSTWRNDLNCSQLQKTHKATQSQSASVSITKADGLIWSAFANLNKVPKLRARCPSSRREMKLRSRPASKASFSCDNPWAKRNCRSTSPKASVGCRAEGFVIPSTVGSMV